MRELKEQVLSIIFNRLKEDRCLVLLFGSTALGEDTERSDIDIGIDCAGGLEDEDFLSLKEELNLYVDTPRRIDLVELRRLPFDFLEFALRGAVIWHVGKDYLKNWLKQEGLTKS
jgi:predicted nucleotidyltransferase